MADLEARFPWVCEGVKLFTHSKMQSSLTENTEHYIVENHGKACKKFWGQELYTIKKNKQSPAALLFKKKKKKKADLS